MSTAQQAATVVALEELGYKVPRHRARGAHIRHLARFPRRLVRLRVGDVISKVNGLKVSSGTSIFQSRLEAIAPGTTVHLVVSAYPGRQGRGR